MKNGYLKILVNIAIVLAILFVMDVVVGWAGEKYMKWLNKNPRNGDAALVNYTLNAANPDVAIIGSSTAICHYDPAIIHDSLMSYIDEDLDVFNMGISNQRLTYDYYGLKCLLDRTTPKIVIADVWATYIGEGDPSFSFSAFRPHTHINPNIKEMLKKHDELNFMSKSNLYCFNTSFVKLIMSLLKSPAGNGFGKNTVEMTEVNKETEKDTTGLLPISIEEFDSMISLAKTNNVKLFVVMSPTLRSSDTTSMSYHYIKDKCLIEGIPFLDYSNNEKYYQPHYFFDRTHLNYYGAELFTQELMKDIKKYIVLNQQ